MGAEKVDRELVRAWVDGWIVSRQASPPVEEEWGFSFDVALPKHVTRHVLPEADEALTVKLMAAFPAPGTQLKVLLPPETVRPWLLPGWTLDDPGFLMTAPLKPVPAPVPDGFRLRTWARGGLVRALVVDSRGSFAARGQIAIPPGADTAVVDQVETAADQRRKGLGGLVMRTLANAAAEAGASTAVLGASTDGRALYTSLGWRTASPLTGIVHRPDAAPVV
ncbi:GNAT family N-acetyltransferase [Streptomyces sp. NEAU-S77]|uniref:GNAT family N-acetyltransferase n=1 Tax=Streptomyces sp. NEAU-S77 TaxID=3411033 RepID=UPI003B9F551D